MERRDRGGENRKENRVVRKGKEKG